MPLSFWQLALALGPTDEPWGTLGMNYRLIISANGLTGKHTPMDPSLRWRQRQIV